MAARGGYKVGSFSLSSFTLTEVPRSLHRIEFINFAVRLLHGVITSHPEDANSKLATNHKHLVAMVRIAFSEGIAQEAGLEQETIQAAFELLENMVTPDEAAALDEMFST
jgi:hypothetical protein